MIAWFVCVYEQAGLSLSALRCVDSQHFLLLLFAIRDRFCDPLFAFLNKKPFQNPFRIDLHQEELQKLKRHTCSCFPCKGNYSHLEVFTANPNKFYTGRICPLSLAFLSSFFNSPRRLRSSKVSKSFFSVSLHGNHSDLSIHLKARKLVFSPTISVLSDY